MQAQHERDQMAMIEAEEARKREMEVIETEKKLKEINDK